MYPAPGATHCTPISWDNAIALTADRRKGPADPNRAVFSTSGRASNEAAFIYQLLARRLGTNNLLYCSNMYPESSRAALSETIGTGKGTVILEDITDHSELIMIVGQNPGTNHPRADCTRSREETRCTDESLSGNDVALCRIWISIEKVGNLVNLLS